MPQSKEVHRKYMHDRRKGSQTGQGSQDLGVEGSQNEGSRQGSQITPEHPVMKYLIDPDKRKKMEAICESLKKHNQLGNVYLGMGRNSLPLDIVGEMSECTRG